MAFGREDTSVTRANGGEDVSCLAGFLSDDDLICHASSSGRNRFGDGSSWNIKGTSRVHNPPFEGRSFDRFSSQAKSPALLRRAFLTVEF
jgi:hypothetical protein